ncbi:MAG: helix-turn-helix transcriptional regulator [Peptococcaceae bacterium]|nr:helix-turn-helix transcriptional regulator [Peptococcaceae bacterium]
MSDFQEYLNEQLKNPAFRAEWEALEPEYQIKRMLIEERTRKQLTQKQLAELTGITQADISRLENGTANPSIRTLQRLAAGLGMMVKVEFVPLPVAKE